MTKIVYTIFLSFFLITQLNAQDRYSIISYAMGIGTDKTNSFIDETSFRGMQLEVGKYFLDERQLSFGVESGFQTFYKEIPKATYTVSDGAITGKQYRYISTIPILVNTMFYPLGHEYKVIPHVGLGVGAYYIDKQLDMGIYSTFTTTWHFGLSPALGFSIPLDYKTNLNINGQYNMAIKTKNKPSESWLAITVGVRYVY